MCPYTYADTLAHFAHRHICTLYTDTLTQSLQQLYTLTHTDTLAHFTHTDALAHVMHTLHAHTNHTHRHTVSAAAVHPDSHTCTHTLHT